MVGINIMAVIIALNKNTGNDYIQLLKFGLGFAQSGTLQKVGRRAEAMRTKSHRCSIPRLHEHETPQSDVIIS